MRPSKHLGQRLNRCALSDDVCTPFDSLAKQDAYAWNAAIGDHAKHGRTTQSLQLFQQMQQECVVPDKISVIHMLSLYTRLEMLTDGKRMHSCLLQEAVHSNVVMGTALLTMYGKHGRVDLAEKIFLQIKEPDVTLWNAMMNIYAQNGRDADVLQFFHQMQVTQLDPDKVTFICVLGSCSRLLDLGAGRVIYMWIVCRKLECESMITTTLVSMYGKCSSLEDAVDLFEKLATKEVATWNTLIDAFSTHGKNKKAIFTFHQMHQEGMVAAKATFVIVLGALSGEESLSSGKQMHAQIVAFGLLSDMVVTTALFGMYASCGSIGDAEDVFEGMAERTSTSWNAMVSEHLQNRCSEKAFQLFDRMLWEGQAPDKVTYLNMLLACTLEGTLVGGTIIHTHIVSSNYVSEVAVATALIAMYGKLEKLESARRLFDSIHERNIISWNCIMRVYAHCTMSKETLQLFEQLKQEASVPNEATLSLCLSVCCHEAVFFKGKHLHVCVAHKSFESEPFLFNVLTSMYAKCGSLSDAIAMSESIPQKDIFTWNNLIEACARKGHDERMAFQNFDQMGQESVLLNVYTLIGILEACCTFSNVRKCQELHASVVHGNLIEDASIASALVKAYGESGEVTQARTVFDSVTSKDAVLWNSIISVYTNQESAVLILQLYAQMLQEGHLSTSITYVSLFSACAHSDFLCHGMRLHSCIRHSKLELDISLMNSLIFMYGKSGFYEVSHRLLFEMPKRDRVSWSGLIVVYAEIGYSKKALQLYYQMVDQDGILPDTSTIVSTLSACACGALLAEGKDLHNHVTFLKLDGDAEVVNSLINMYGKCGDLDDALCLFASLPRKDICSWNTVLTLLSYHGHDIMAIELFKEMLQAEVLPSDITFSSLLASCGNIASLVCGRIAHFMVACSEIDTPTVANALISMYGKCGSFKDALRQFTKLSVRDAISWNATIAACAQHGCGKEAMELLDMMHRARSSPNEVSYLIAMLACSHAGLVDAGCFLWVSMCQDLKIKPGSEHSSCLVDSFSRAGQLLEANQFLVNMPYQPCSASWTALLSACRDDVNAPQGVEIGNYLFEMDPFEFSTHIMLSNIQCVAAK